MKQIIKKLMFILIFSNLFFYNFGLINNGFALLINLYNEKKLERICEYIICLEENLKNKCIKKIHVIYDTSKDDGNCLLLNYLKRKEVLIKFINKRPTYEDFFNLSNSIYSNSKIIISNADIFFDETLDLLLNYDLNNKFIGLTRWNINKGGRSTLYLPRSQDSWIFQTPIKKFKSDFELGVLGCEHALMYNAIKNKFITLNPCFSIKTHHLHLSGIRNYSKNDHIKYLPGYEFLKHSYLNIKRKHESYLTRKTIFNYSLELKAYDYAKKNKLNDLSELMLPLAIKAELNKINWKIKEVNDTTINKLNHLGETALIFSIKNKYFDLAELLLEFGADPRIVDHNNLSAYDWVEIIFKKSKF